MKESIDATLDPVLARAVVKLRTGWNINFGGEEIDYAHHLCSFADKTNPHYQPEVAQCAIVNFIATEEDGGSAIGQSGCQRNARPRRGEANVDCNNESSACRALQNAKRTYWENGRSTA